MPELFSAQYLGPAFESLGPAHIGALTLIFVLNIALSQFRGTSGRSRDRLRMGLAVLIWTAEASWHIWNLLVGTWNIQTMLPLNTCSILIWLSGIMLLQRQFQIYEFAYFLGIGGALQYLATPDLGIYGFPHFRFFQSFTSHGLLLTAPIYMSVVEGFRPTLNSLRRVVIGANAYAVLVFGINLAIGSNYLMLNSKPATPSLLDLLPAWPLYLPFMEVFGLASCLLLYLPFLLKDYLARRRQLQL